MVIDMKIDIEAARALLYETSRVVDYDNCFAKKLEFDPPADKEQLKQTERGFETLWTLCRYAYADDEIFKLGDVQQGCI